MKVFIYACEQTYGGLHGIEDFCVEEFEDDEFTDEDELDNWIWKEYITEMSHSLIDSYSYLFDSEEEENNYNYDDGDVDGYWCFIKEDVTLSLKELNEEACRLGPDSFKKKYCEVE